MAEEIKKGLMGIVVDETTISQVMPEINSLTYRGYKVQDLCEKCSFEEVAYLVLNGELPKSKELISKDEMIKKIKEAVASRKDQNFLVIVRTDANLVEGLEKTIERIKAYEAAGADIIFPESMKDEKEFESIRKNSKVFLLANMTEFGKSKLLSTKELKDLGYNIVIYPVTTQRLAMKSVEDGLRSIFKDGHQNNIIDKMQTRKRLYELVEYEKYNTPDKKITDFKTEGHE